MEAHHLTLSFYAAALDKPPPPKPAALLKPLRKRSSPGADGRPLEKHVLKLVVDALRLDKRVARVERNQSGVFQDGNRFIRVGSKGKLDLTVYLLDGRYVEIEVKRSADVRLLRDAQRQRIHAIRSAGGLAGWCWNVESAIALLPNE
jgi:hypothetical protein